MNATDLCRLSRCEIERLLSWLRCYPVAGREDERKSLESVLLRALPVDENPDPMSQGIQFESTPPLVQFCSHCRCLHEPPVIG
jgi:hypothetical protein